MYYYQRLRDLREDADKKQSEIAQLLEISQQHYSQYEQGKNELPMHHFITLARYYNVSLDYLAGIIQTPDHIQEETRRTSQDNKDIIFAKKVKKAYEETYAK